MTEWEQWRSRTFPIDYNKVRKIIETGFCYIGKRDRDFRPTIVVNCDKIFSNKIYLSFAE
jgi:hypothetical protein